MPEQPYAALERKIDDLIKLCGKLDNENRQLKAEASKWLKDREQLIEKTTTTEQRIEAMIGRLKALEQES